MIWVWIALAILATCTGIYLLLAASSVKHEDLHQELWFHGPDDDPH